MICVYFQTYCLKKILEAITDGGKEKRAAAYIYALLAFVAALSKVSNIPPPDDLIISVFTMVSRPKQTCFICGTLDVLPLGFERS